MIHRYNHDSSVDRVLTSYVGGRELGPWVRLAKLAFKYLKWLVAVVSAFRNHAVLRERPLNPDVDQFDPLIDQSDFLQFFNFIIFLGNFLFCFVTIASSHLKNSIDQYINLHNEH